MKRNMSEEYPYDNEEKQTDESESNNRMRGDEKKKNPEHVQDIRTTRDRGIEGTDTDLDEDDMETEEHGNH